MFTLAYTPIISLSVQRGPRLREKSFQSIFVKRFTQLNSSAQRLESAQPGQLDSTERQSGPTHLQSPTPAQLSSIPFSGSAFTCLSSSLYVSLSLCFFLL